MVVERLLRICRRPEIRNVNGAAVFGERAERGGHHADDFVGFTIERDLPAEDGRISSEPVAPQVIGQDHHARTPGAILLGKKRSTECWRHAKHREHVPGDSFAEQLFGRSRFREDRRHRGKSGQVVERPVGALIIDEVCGRYGQSRVPPLVDFPQRDEPCAFGIWERPEHDGIDDAEDRRIGADAEGQREHGHRREAGRTAEKTERVAKVMKEHDTRGAKAVPGEYAPTIPIITLGYGVGRAPVGLSCPTSEQRISC